jgi:hypothetical protein
MKNIKTTVNSPPAFTDTSRDIDRESKLNGLTGRTEIMTDTP